MNNDLISREYLKKNWNGIDTPVGYRKVVDLEVINNAPTVAVYTEEQVKELIALNKKLSEERSQCEWVEEIIEELESRKDYGTEYAQAMEDVNK